MVRPIRSAETQHFLIDNYSGGGYLMPMEPGQMDWMAYVKEEAAKAGVDISVCILEYCSLNLTKPLSYHKPSNILPVLIPSHPYPHQMIGAISAFKYLLAAGYEPGNVEPLFPLQQYTP